MGPTVDVVYEHLAALRSSLHENRWVSRVDPQVLVLFNELLAAARKSAPEQVVLRKIERQQPTVGARTLLILIDQMLVALS